MKKIFIQKIFVAFKLSAFCFEIITFFSWMLYQFHIAFTAAGMWYSKHGSVLQVRIHRGKGSKFSKIVANLH